MMVDPTQLNVDNERRSRTEELVPARPAFRRIERGLLPYIRRVAIGRYFGEASVLVQPSGRCSPRRRHPSDAIPLSGCHASRSSTDGRHAAVRWFRHARSGTRWRTALVTLLEDDELRHKMGAAGRNKLETRVGPEVIGPQHIEVYERALRGRRR